MLVSVVIPVYNGEKYLGEAIESVLNQKGVDETQIIVIDDGSNDRTAEVAREYSSKITYLFQQNQGVGAARNLGVGNAKGEFLAFLDADDLWHEQKLSRQVELILDSEVDMVFTWLEHFKCPQASDRFYQNKNPMPGMNATTLLIRKNAFLMTGAFVNSRAVGEFIDWYSRALEKGLQSKVLREVLAYRRVHDNNMTTRERGSFHNYATVLKAHLDRKRMK